MKRGKRQIQQRSNIFQSEQQPQNTASSIFSSSFDQSQNNTFELNESKPVVIESRNQQKKVSMPTKPIVVSQNNNHENSVEVYKQENQSAEGKQTLSADDERKKRLEMLRQKYLKTGDSKTVNNANKQQQQKIQVEKQVIPKKTQSTTKKQTVQKVNGNSFFQSLSSNANTNQQYAVRADSDSQQSGQNNCKLQNQTPFSKPTAFENKNVHQPIAQSHQQSSRQSYSQVQSQSHVQKLSQQNPPQIVLPRRAVPPPPSNSKRGKAPPPVPPKSKPEAIYQAETKHQSQEVEQKNKPETIQQQKLASNITSTPVPPKRVSHPGQKRRLPQPTTQFKESLPANQSNINSFPDTKPQNLPQNEAIDNQQTSLATQIRRWLSNENILPVQNESYMQRICQQIGLQNSLANGFLLQFAIKNRVEYTTEQAKFIKEIIQRTSGSSIAKFILAIKCGGQYIRKYYKKYSSLIQQIRSFKNYFLPSQLSSLTSQVLQQNPSDSTLTTLAFLTPSSPNLQSHLLSHKFQSPVWVFKILQSLRSSLDQTNSALYLKLINNILNHVQDSTELENILGLINEVNFQNVYQIKKDIKLKIIQKIDNLTNNNNFGNTHNYKAKEKNHQQQFNADNKQQSGSGVTNLFGYVGQAIKIIKSQIPEKQQTEVKNNAAEESSEGSFKWDPVSGRYLINGKIPDDEFGNSTVQPEVKKKPPPPPPRPLKTGSNRQAVQPTPSPPRETEEPNNLVSTYFPSEQAQQNNEQSKGYVVPPPSQRIGIKGIANKKSKIQARYT